MMLPTLWEQRKYEEGHVGQPRNANEMFPGDHMVSNRKRRLHDSDMQVTGHDLNLDEDYIVICSLDKGERVNFLILTTEVLGWISTIKI